ncbi:P-type conjugative transfer protein TrbJ [Phenylobacterium soli]|uniref:P-type conjugative transfer protein TrbJ n=1 Tax=Phenylobacterium soli TaxID=2170551 RepID=A0A328AJ13_9CAUL|nr:P-type conjugative transfer protein TrbJ [Phenylobacterium soli]RAK54933.1 P-type conjugative transfer protein TrbJ [Phenylobacterium soli]
MRPRAAQLVATMAAAFLMQAGSASAQLTVYDPSNYASNVLQAARALEQINNQVRSLQNQALSLSNQARNLAQLPYSSLQTLQGDLGRITQLTQRARGLAYDVQAIDRAFARDYAVQPGSSDASLVAAAQTRWSNASAAFEDSLQMQAGVISGLPASRGVMSSLVGASQGATGILQATQAGNQLLALQSQQLADLTAVVAAQGRAAALEQADRAASRAQAQEQFRRFMDRGQGYQPRSVEIFR